MLKPDTGGYVEGIRERSGRDACPPMFTGIIDARLIFGYPLSWDDSADIVARAYKVRQKGGRLGDAALRGKPIKKLDSSTNLCHLTFSGGNAEGT